MSHSKLVSIHGRRAYLGADDILVSKVGMGSGGDGKASIVMPGSVDYCAIWEDFLGDTGNLSAVKGDTGATIDIGNETNGVAKITSTTQPASPSGLVGKNGLGWKVNQGKGAFAGSLRMAARIKKSIYTATGKHGVFVGFTDVATAEMPVYDTGGTADKGLATNAFGIGWNNQGDTGWMGYGVDGDSVQETPLTTDAPTANTYVAVEMHARRGTSDTGGSVTFFIDGVPRGSIDNPCNVTTNLVPCLWAYDTGGAATLDVDWVNVSAPRDTGE